MIKRKFCNFIPRQTHAARLHFVQLLSRFLHEFRPFYVLLVVPPNLLEFNQCGTFIVISTLFFLSTLNKLTPYLVFIYLVTN